MTSRLRLTLLLTVLSWISQRQAVFGQELNKRYAVFNRQLSPGTEPGAVHLNEASNAGVAWITGKYFTQGTIEFDVKGRDQFQASFVGVAFHGMNDTTYEAVYFRPFNFKAADAERKAHAVQYIALPNFDWPKLRADFHNQYEQPVSPQPDPNQWFHVRINVEKQRITVTVNNNDRPVLVVEPLLVQYPGTRIGLWAGNGSDGDWKNIKITP